MINMSKNLPKFRYPMTFLPCKDLALTRKFYHDILGLTIALEQGKCVIFQIGDQVNLAYWGFCSHYTEFIENPKQVCLTLVVENEQEVDRWHKYLLKQGVECTKNPARTPQFKIYNAFFKDPMGYTLEVQMFDEGGKPSGVY